MFNPNNRPGQFFQTHKRRVMNRSAATVAVGDVLSIDMLGTATETAAGQGVGGITGLDVQDAIFHNAVAVAAGNIDGLTVVVTSLLSGAGVDNTEVEVALCGQRVQVECEGTTDIVVGDKLIAVAAQTYLVIHAAGSLAKVCGYALEGQTSATPAKIDVCFFGGAPGPGVDDDGT